MVVGMNVPQSYRRTRVQPRDTAPLLGGGWRAGPVHVGRAKPSGLYTLVHLIPACARLGDAQVGLGGLPKSLPPSRRGSSFNMGGRMGFSFPGGPPALYEVGHEGKEEYGEIPIQVRYPGRANSPCVLLYMGVDEFRFFKLHTCFWGFGVQTITKYNHKLKTHYSNHMKTLKPPKQADALLRLSVCPSGKAYRLSADGSLCICVIEPHGKEEKV